MKAVAKAIKKIPKLKYCKKYSYLYEKSIYFFQQACQTNGKFKPCLTKLVV